MFGIFFFFLARADKLLFPSFPSVFWSKKNGQLYRQKKKKISCLQGCEFQGQGGVATDGLK